jgi:hypothetical protein
MADMRISHQLLWLASYPNTMATSKQHIIDPERDLILSSTNPTQILCSPRAASTSALPTGASLHRRQPTYFQLSSRDMTKVLLHQV